MKKLLLLGTVFSAAIFGAKAQSPWGTQVGHTFYDLPSNSSQVNRIVYNEDDGSVSITWIQSITEDAQPTFERGAGYNHMRGGSWVHGSDGACRVNNACTQEYSGWPEIINFPKEDVTIGGVTYTDVSKEIIIAHSGGLKKLVRSYRSDSAWQPVEKLLIDQNYCEPGTEGIWPRMVREGSKYIHGIATHAGDDLAAVARCGVHTSIDHPLLYYRSSDQGETWDVQNYAFEKDTTYFKRGGGDQYAIDANGDVVAVLAGGYDEPWIMWKSRDKGLTWERTIIRDWDPGVYDVEAFFNDGSHGREVSDGAHSVVVDDDGTVHCFTGVSIGSIDQNTGEFGGSATFGNSGIWYWNDKMPDFCEPVIIADVVDYYDGSGNAHANPIYSDNPSWDGFDFMAQTSAGYFASATTMPTSAVDANGNIYVVYSSDVEKTSTETGADLLNGSPFRDIYMVWSNDGGTTWSYEINVGAELAGFSDNNDWGSDLWTASGIEEDVYPAVAHKVGSDNTLHIMWNMDYKVGSDVQLDNGEFSNQYLTYYGVDVTSLTMSAKTTVVPNPNTIGSIEDSADYAGSSYTVNIEEGFYTTLSPSVAFLDTTITIDTCFRCGGFSSVDTTTCIDTTCVVTGDTLGSCFDCVAVWDTCFGCGPFSHIDTTTCVDSMCVVTGDTIFDCYDCAGPGSVLDSIVSADTVWMDTFFISAMLDSIVSVDTMWVDTISSIDTTVVDLNSDGDSIYTFGFHNSGQYTITAVYGNACPDPSATFNVISLGGPITAMASVAGDDTVEICSGESVELLGIPGGGLNGVYTSDWSDGTSSISANMTVMVSPTTSTMYYYTATDGGSATDSVYVMVNTLPAAGSAGADASIDLSACDNPSVILGPSSEGPGMTYSWSPQVGMTGDDALTYDPSVQPTVTTTYTLTTTEVATGCVATDMVTVTVTGTCAGAVGLKENLDVELSVYPNPASDVVNIEVGEATMEHLTVYNHLGRVVEQINLNGTTQYAVNTSNYVSGIYFLYVQTNKGQVTKQITIAD